MKRYVNGVEVEVSAEEQAAIEAEWAANARKRRRERTAVAIRTDVDGLTQANVMRLVRAMVAERIAADPGFARRHGVEIDGDEAMP